MDQNPENLPARRDDPQQISRQRVTPERRAAYLAALRATGSHFSASAAATPNPNTLSDSNHRPGAYDTFLKLRRRDPIFEAECAEALGEAVGRAEQELSRRMFLPSERPIIDRAGKVVAVATDFRNADNLLLRFLQRHSPDVWSEIQKRQIDSTVHVNHNGATSGGAGYTINADVLAALDENDRIALGNLMCKAEEKRLELEQQKKREQNLLEDQQ